MPRKPIITVTEAAKLIQVTTSAIYTAIRKNKIPAARKDGQITVRRADVLAYRRAQIQWFRDHERRKRGDLTDEEFLLRMLDNDPP